MSDQQHEKLSKLHESREKAELEIKMIHQQSDKDVKNGDRRVRAELLVTSFKDAMTKAINKHNQLLALTHKFDDFPFHAEGARNLVECSVDN